MAYSADLCGSKLRGKLGAVLNESATTFSPALLSSDKSFAKRQLEKMGWTEGTGLGKRRDGMKEHVKIKQREDEMGLGREKMKAQEVADVWWKDSAGDTLARLQKKKNSAKDDKGKKKKSKKKKKNDKKEKIKRHFTDEELFAACGGARFGSTSGARANRSQHGKWKRSESGHELTELEKKAKESMEWNGRGNAQLLISKESSATSDVGAEKDADTINIIPSTKEEDLPEASTTEEKESKKKKRKLEKKESKRTKKAKKGKDDDEEVHAVSLPASEEEEEKKSAKRAKKDKKKKSKQ
jgi:Pin2-interacting protein X1